RRVGREQDDRNGEHRSAGEDAGCGQEAPAAMRPRSHEADACGPEAAEEGELERPIDVLAADEVVRAAPDEMIEREEDPDGRRGQARRGKTHGGDCVAEPPQVARGSYRRLLHDLVLLPMP